MLLNKRLRYILSVTYFLFVSVLFVLPGSAFPKEDWLSAIYFDKWVHIGIFLGLALVWSWAIGISELKALGALFGILVLYGIVIEGVQHQFVTNRSFDLGDWAADIAGSFLGVWFWNLRYIKKIDPCRNRGRNQN